MFGKNLKKWAKENDLHYEKKEKLSLIRSENVTLKNIIWGERNGNRVFIFEVMNETGTISDIYYYCNQGFYKEIKYHNVEQALSGELRQNGMSALGGETEVEIIEIIVADIFLQGGKKIEYDVVKKVLTSLKKYYRSKVGVKDVIIGHMIGMERSDVHYDSEESMEFVCKDSGIERETVEIVAKKYEELLGKFNQ